MVTSNIIIETIINKLKFDYSNEEGNSAYKEILIGGDKLLVIRVSNHRTHLQTWADRYPRTLQPSRKLIKKMGNNLPIVYRKKYFFSFVFEDEPTAPDTNVKGKKVVVFESVQETKDIQDNQVLLIIRGLSNFMKNPAQYDATILGNQEKVTNITTENKTTKDMKESKQIVKLNESQLRQVIKESIKKMLNERSLDDVEHTNLYGYDDTEDYADEELVKVANPGDYTSAFIDYLKELIGSQADGLSLNSFIQDMRNGKIRYCEKNDGIYYINDWPGI